MKTQNCYKNRPIFGGNRHSKNAMVVLEIFKLMGYPDLNKLPQELKDVLSVFTPVEK